MFPIGLITITTINASFNIYRSIPNTITTNSIPIDRYSIITANHYSTITTIHTDHYSTITIIHTNSYSTIIHTNSYSTIIHTIGCSTIIHTNPMATVYPKHEHYWQTIYYF